MLTKNWIIILLATTYTCLGTSFNQPKFSSCAKWNDAATTFADQNCIGQQPTDIFINRHDKIFVTERQNGQILIWYKQSPFYNKTIMANFTNSWSLFVTENNDIYIDNGFHKNAVDRWSRNGSVIESVMEVASSCTGLFVDILKSLYCSSSESHSIYKLDHNSNALRPRVIAGTGCSGPVMNMLDHPHGIFVDKDFRLYVADSRNNRIQRFDRDETNGITIAGFGAEVIFILDRPTDVVLDGDDHMFIVDSGKHRIIRSLSGGFKCLFGCSHTPGTAPDQLNEPYAMAFDSNGNIFVTDVRNHRIQKFDLIQNDCVQSTMTPLPTQCSNYTLITDSTRNINSVRTTVLCDRQSPMTVSGSWFRFSGGAGTMLVNYTVPIHQCGTHATGWFNGAFPSETGTISSGTTCYHWGNNICNWSNGVTVTKCSDFYVFFLVAPPVCSLRYCTV
ncbi:unnamed protein product [Adineta ricciae]|uniref:UMOD/GP2/OIT3-like D8C domain-containing protein n=1 Tax=Adineta ricciae TaxID=249248 RepID=A0A814WZK1_ADIRI|nr:unnamed protein product [Adineta ricciae]CAF1208242.1 unnamed protein product [Adineta ricciae]